MVEDELIYSPLNDVLPVPIQQVDVIDDSVWLLGAGRLFRWTEEQVREVSVDSVSNILNMSGLSTGSLALTTPRLELLQLVDDALHLQKVPNLLPTSVGATLSQRLLVSEGDAEIICIKKMFGRVFQSKV